MNKHPVVSILMATYNRASIIAQTIQSIQKQTIQNWQLVIADDGSSDETPTVVKEWIQKEPRITYVRSEVNQGISKNYNMGFSKCVAPYIAMIDDDDPWCDEKKLEKQLAFLDKNKEFVGCGGGAIVINSEGKELYRYLKPETNEQIKNRMLFSNPMANSTTMFRKDIAEKVGWYDGSIRYAGDRDFWMKIGLLGKLYNFPEYFTYYTISGDNTSIKKIRPHLKTSLEVMKRYKGRYPYYYPALVLNTIQYWYAFLPQSIQKIIHTSLAQIKRKTVG